MLFTPPMLFTTTEINCLSICIHDIIYRFLYSIVYDHQLMTTRYPLLTSALQHAEPVFGSLTYFWHAQPIFGSVFEVEIPKFHWDWKVAK